MAKMNYNPFHTTATDGWKLKTVLLGTPDSMGVFDYVSILPIAYKPAIHAAKSGNHKKTEWTLWALTRPWELVKLISALVITIAAIPVVLVAALVVAPFALMTMAGVSFANWLGRFGGKNKVGLDDPFAENKDNEPLLPNDAKKSSHFDHTPSKAQSPESVPSDDDEHDFDLPPNRDANDRKSPGQALN